MTQVSKIEARRSDDLATAGVVLLTAAVVGTAIVFIHDCGGGCY